MMIWRRFKKGHQRYPEATVGALVVDKAGRILLVRSHKWGSKVSVPGGHIELGERSVDAVKREVKEEVGLDVEPVELLLVQEAIYPEDFYKKEHYIFLDYLCEAKSNEVRLDTSEVQGYLWANPIEALAFDLEPYTRKLVEAYLRRLGKTDKP